MKAYKVEILVIDHDDLGADEIELVIESTKYPNWCMYPTVMNIKQAEIGEWSDEHPLNKNGTIANAYHQLNWEDAQ